MVEIYEHGEHHDEPGLFPMGSKKNPCQHPRKKEVQSIMDGCLQHIYPWLKHRSNEINREGSKLRRRMNNSRRCTHAFHHQPEGKRQFRNERHEVEQLDRIKVPGKQEPRQTAQ